MSKGKFTSNNTEIPFQIYEIFCLYGCKIAQANRKTKTLNNSSTISFGYTKPFFASVKNHVYIPITNEIYSTSMTKALPNSFHDDLTMYTMSSICQTIQVYLSALNLISGLRMSSWL